MGEGSLPGLMAVHPIQATGLWLRWLGAVLVVVWLPGHLLVGRWLRGLDWVSRQALSLSAGLLLIALVSALYPLAGLPLRPLFTVLPILLLAWGLSRWAGHRRAVAAWSDGLSALTSAQQGALVLCSVFVMACLLVGFADFCAPPHVHDASNHAFMVLRIAQTGSSDPRVVFTPEIGRPDVLYLMGWQTTAALTSQVSGVAPYISCWYFPLLALALLPVTLTVLWRALGLPVLAVLFGALIVATNDSMPSSILGWGGFGQIIGMFLVPNVMLALRAALRDRGVYGGALAGAWMASLLQIHTSQVFVAMLLAVVSLLGQERQCKMTWSALGRASLAILVAFVAVAAPMGLKLAYGYAHKIAALSLPELMTPRAALRWLYTSGGEASARHWLVMLGGLSAVDRRFRRTAMLAWALAALFFAFVVVGDPLSTFLATPFYREWPRLRYLLIFAVPPLMAFPIQRLVELQVRRGWRFVLTLAIAAGSFLLLSPHLRAQPGMFRSYRALSPFTAEDYALARDLPRVVAADEVVGNFFDDGSAWAMHVSGRQFFLPCAWRLSTPAGVALLDIAADLRTQPWPAATRALEAAGVRYLYASDHRWPSQQASYMPSAFDADPRFEPILRAAHAALYRIHWDSSAADSASQRIR